MFVFLFILCFSSLKHTNLIQNENFENYMSFDNLNQDESNGTIFIMKRALNIILLVKIFSIFEKYYKKKFFY